MRIPYFHVDAFTAERFHGNAAGVCLLDQPLDEATMLAIAAENRHSETAFLVGRDGEYAIRWFTPTVEVDLCGHATLAAGLVICERVELGRERVALASASGRLDVERRGDLYVLDFPARPPAPVDAVEHAAVAAALGREPVEVRAARDAVAVLASADDVRRVAPDLAGVAALPRFALTVTAPGDEEDYVYRFFAPAQGVPEDPATGSAQSTLAPYWSARLGRASLRSRQLSARGAEFATTVAGDRVEIGGRGVIYLEGLIEI